MNYRLSTTRGGNVPHVCTPIKTCTTNQSFSHSYRIPLHHHLQKVCIIYVRYRVHFLLREQLFYFVPRGKKRRIYPKSCGLEKLPSPNSRGQQVYVGSLSKPAERRLQCRLFAISVFHKILRSTEVRK